MKKTTSIWMIPPLLGILALGFLLWTNNEKKHISKELHRVVQEHVESVVKLIREAFSEAATAVDLVYSMSERDLETLSRLGKETDLLSPVVQMQLSDAGVEVLVKQLEKSAPAGFWGPVPEQKRLALFEDAGRYPQEEIIEDGVAEKLGLYCAYFVNPNTKLLVCRDAGKIAQMRRETGLGPLLRHTIGHNVLYSAIQDENGVLAGFPGPNLSTWQDDPELDLVRKGASGAIVFRTISSQQGTATEGLTPFELPDGSTGVLRVGVDASHVVAVEKAIDTRHTFLTVALAVLLLLSIIGSTMANGWIKRRQEVEQKLKKQQEANKHWQAIGQMAGTVAHEVRNPLNTLSMLNQRMKREFEVSKGDKDEYEGMLRLIAQELNRVNSVITEFLDLGRPLSLNTETVELSDLLEQSLQPQLMRAKEEDKKILIKCTNNESLNLDKLRFLQIMGNLVSNALDALSDGGTVTVNSRSSKKSLEIEVADDGPGMEKEIAQRSTEPFYTTKAKGTGLGLPLVERLVQAHGGNMSIISSPGEGTRVKLIFPKLQRTVRNSPHAR